MVYFAADVAYKDLMSGQYALKIDQTGKINDRF